MGAFGERLKREREKRKITLEEIANATKISAHKLRALEEEQFDKLPGGVFNKGFVRAYARHVGLSEDQTVNEYNEAFRATHPEEPTTDPEAEGRKILEQRVLRVQQERPRLANFPWQKAAVAAVLLAFGVALWGSYSHYQNKSKTAVKRPETHRLLKPASEETVAQKTAKPVSTSNRASSSIGDQSSHEVLVDAPANAAGSFRVSVHAREESWIHITADGKDVLEDTLRPDTQKSVRASSQLVIRAGNIGGLDFWFNGQKLPVQGDLDQVKTITFDSAGLVTSTPKLQPVSDQTAQ